MRIIAWKSGMFHLLVQIFWFRKFFIKMLVALTTPFLHCTGWTHVFRTLVQGSTIGLLLSRLPYFSMILRYVLYVVPSLPKKSDSSNDKYHMPAFMLKIVVLVSYGSLK